jgi:hypothetical protein
MRCHPSSLAELRNPRCYVVMAVKKTNEEVVTLWRTSGFDPDQPLDYRGMNEKMWVTHMPCGIRQQKKLSSAVSGDGCRFCSGRMTWSSEQAAILFKDKGWTPVVLPFVYTNGRATIEVRCNTCGYVCKKSIFGLAHGASGCAQCAGQRRYTQAEAESLFANHGWLPPRGYQYVNCGVRTAMQCASCGQTSPKSLGDVVSGHRGCQNCLGRRRKTTSELLPIFASEGYAVGSGWQYERARHPIPMMCPSGHTCSISWSCWHQGHRWPPLQLHAIGTEEQERGGYTALAFCGRRVLPSRRLELPRLESDHSHDVS